MEKLNGDSVWALQQCGEVIAEDDWEMLMQKIINIRPVLIKELDNVADDGVDYDAWVEYSKEKTFDDRKLRKKRVKKTRDSSDSDSDSGSGSDEDVYTVESKEFKAMDAW